MGGRGGASGLTDWLGKEGGVPGEAKPMDITQFEGWTLERVEQRLRNLKHEELFVLDENDKIIAAYKGNRTSVAFPAELLDQKGLTVTHGHPKNGAEAADFGGTFSFADMGNMLKSQWAEHRATASGQGEMNYILRKGKNAKPKQFYNQINRDYTRLNKEISDAYKAEYKKAKDSGVSTKQAQHRARQVSVGILNAYYKQTASKYGYEYITKKKEYKYNR
jgi:hypothetical protein